MDKVVARARIAKIVVGLAVLYTGTTFAEVSSSKPFHHFFNSRLLDPQELQISIFGNFKVGLTENLEVGTQGGILLLSNFKAPNISLKHRMFRGSNFETSFTSHSFYSSTSETVNGLSEDDEESTSSSSDESVTISSTSFISVYGVVTTHDITNRDFFNWGIYDYFTYQGVDLGGISIDMNVHNFAPMIGYDRYLTKHWIFSTSLVRPFWVTGDIKSEIADIELNSTFFPKVPGELDLTASFLTFTYSGDDVNFEFGRVYFPFIASGGLGRYTTYLNVYWRFN